MYLYLAVVGSRSISDYNFVKDEITKYLEEEKIPLNILTLVSGGAKGIDSLAKQFAEENNIDIVEIFPDWEKFGKSAGFLRNKDIISKANYILAIWDGKSKGTKHSIDLVKKLNKPLKIIVV